MTIAAPELSKTKQIRFTQEQWNFLCEQAVETGVREPQIFLRQLIDREMKTQKARTAVEGAR